MCRGSGVRGNSTTGRGKSGNSSCCMCTIMASYSRRMQIAGKVVLITGASQGIGRACVEAFRRRGAKLALTARSQDKLQDAAGTDALAIAGDLTSGDFRKRVVDTVAGKYG